MRLNDRNIAELKLVEIPVKQMKLLFRDRDTGKFIDKSSIKPEAVNRWMTTRPGQVLAVSWMFSQLLACFLNNGLFTNLDVPAMIHSYVLVF